MTDPLATIVVVPREQFTRARDNLESIHASTSPDYRLVYVDGNSPHGLAGELESQAREGRMTLVRCERYLAGNEARNLALEHVRTKYVAFIDNDVLVWPGWLDALVRCAEETGAWVVGPLYCIGPRGSTEVHTSGATLSLTGDDGKRTLREEHYEGGKAVDDVRARMGLVQRDEVEFHCLLARTSIFDELGPLDPKLLSFFDHTDLGLMVQQAGGTTYTEPSAVVTYWPPEPLAWRDLPFFQLRWSKAWYNSSLRHFCAKWSLDTEDPVFRAHDQYRLQHRARLPTPDPRINRRLDRLTSGILERTVIRRLERQRMQGAAPASVLNTAA